ncbi:MAG: protoporphyrinogen oxidase HemJ [Amaricoccus sp.]
MNALLVIYPWVKAFHVVAVVSWMAGLLYLPRIFVYHAELGTPGSELSETFKVMERRLLKLIMRPAFVATWVLGIALLLTPGVISWKSDGWIYIKLATVLVLTWFHHWLLRRQKDFAADRNRFSGRTYRMANELPTVALVIIAIMVIVRPF